MITAFLVALVLQVQPQLLPGVTATWERGGWTITTELTDPSPNVIGTGFAFTAEATYYRDSETVQQHVNATPMQITVGESEYSVVYRAQVNDQFVVVDQSGEGTAGITDGVLQWSCRAKNDGKSHMAQFRIRPKQ